MAEQINPGQLEPEITEDVKKETPFHVLLFNDDWHTFDEVINQLIKALRCSVEKASEFALEAHNNGKAVVFTGPITECLKVSGILEEIALHTQIVS